MGFSLLHPYPWEPVEGKDWPAGKAHARRTSRRPLTGRTSLGVAAGGRRKRKRRGNKKRRSGVRRLPGTLDVGIALLRGVLHVLLNLSTCSYRPSMTAFCNVPSGSTILTRHVTVHVGRKELWFGTINVASHCGFQIICLSLPLSLLPCIHGVLVSSFATFPWTPYAFAEVIRR
ncbi:hypothetical protein LX32DRAFT_52282 [Colletotrichum zoysiae]|uniref:Uncharacterized protein n=1 Tax=Colletotrichum zoysiae TaxID=1216348 RepID=A0AAD9HB18_9PEZI|nr:hypothetical protein LX32DRAFT_52282 [Colletotrichum zoysiae]